MRKLILAFTFAAVPACAQQLPTIALPQTNLPPAQVTGTGSSNGSAYSPQLAHPTNAGAFLADPFAQYTAAGQRNTWYLGNAYPWILSYPTTTDAKGGGEVWGQLIHMHQNATGRSVGNGSGVTGPEWYTTHGLDVLATCDGAGICEGFRMNSQKNAMIGDHSFVRWNVNQTSGGQTAASDEGFKGQYFNVNPINTYRGTVSGNAANVGGTGNLYTTPGNGGCGAFGNAFGDSICSGGGSYLLQTSPNGLLYTAVATSIALPSGNSPGSIVTDIAVTPSVAYASIPAAVPDTTNFLNGDSVTVGISSVTGTIPPNGSACVSAAGGTVAEEMPYTYNASAATVTLSGHRFPHSSSAAIFFNSCSYAVFTQDTADSGGNASVYLILGATDTHTLAWASYGFGARGSGSIGKGASSIGNGSAFTVRQGALVVHTHDPSVTTGVGTFFQNNHTGYFRLGSNTVAWSNGDTVEQPFEPSTQWYMHDENCAKLTSDTGVASACHHEAMSANIPYWTQLVLNNDLGVVGHRGSTNIMTISGSGPAAGTFNDLYTLHVAPTGAVIHIDGCAGGDSSSTCTNTPEIYLLNDTKTGNGPLQIHYNKAAGTFGMRGDGGVNINGVTMTPSQGGGSIAAQYVKLKPSPFANNIPCAGPADLGLSFLPEVSGVKDVLQVCLKDASNTYAVHTIQTN